MIIYENEKVKFELNSKNDIYENSKDFDYEKTYEDRYNHSLFDDRPYNWCIYKRFSEEIKNNKYPFLDKLLKTEQHYVKITKTNKKNGKTKQFEDIRYSNYIYDTLKIYNRTKKLLAQLKGHYEKLDWTHTKKHSETVTKEIKKTLKLIDFIEHIKLFATNLNKDKNLMKKCKLLLKEVKRSIEYNTEFGIGSYHYKTIISLPAFTSKDYEKMNNLIEQINANLQSEQLTF